MNLNEAADEDTLIEMLQSLYSSNKESLDLNVEDLEYLNQNCDEILEELQESIDKSEENIETLKGTLSITSLQIEYSSSNLLEIYNIFIDEEEQVIDGLLGIYNNKQTDFEDFSVNLVKYLDKIYDQKSFITTYDIFYAMDDLEEVQEDNEEIFLQMAEKTREDKLNMLKKFSFLQEKDLAKAQEKIKNESPVLPKKSLIQGFEISFADHELNQKIIGALSELIQGLEFQLSTMQTELEELIGSLDAEIAYHHDLITDYRNRASESESQLIILESSVTNANSMLSSYNAELESYNSEYQTEQSFCSEQQAYYEQEIEVQYFLVFIQNLNEIHPSTMVLERTGPSFWKFWQIHSSFLGKFLRPTL